VAQLSLFSSDARPAGLGDLAGLLCGPGRISRFGAGDTARLSVVVADESRVPVLRAEAAARAIPLEVGVAPCGSPELRTTYRRDLAELAAAWTGPDGRKVVPPDLQLDGTLLRLWSLVAGRADDRGGYLLLLDPDAPWTHERLIAAATRVGLPPARAGSPTCGGTRPCARHGTLGPLPLPDPEPAAAAGPGDLTRLGLAPHDEYPAHDENPGEQPHDAGRPPALRRSAGRHSAGRNPAGRNSADGPGADRADGGWPEEDWPEDHWSAEDWPIDEDESGTVIGGGVPAPRPERAAPGRPRPVAVRARGPEPAGHGLGAPDATSLHVPDLDGAGVPPPAPRECRAAGPALRIGGTRRMQRLAELVGTPPGGVPAAEWPRYWGRNIA
jgi:hypothetical protein